MLRALALAALASSAAAFVAQVTVFAPTFSPMLVALLECWHLE